MLSRRLLGYLFTLLLAVALNFLIPRAMPGDPLALIAGDAVRQMGAERIAELRHAYGLDKPVGEQFIVYLGRLLRGDLGQSYRYSGGRSVAHVLMDRFTWTFLLVFVSVTIATLAGVSLGAWSATRHGRASDLGLLSALFALRSVPSFWLAMILIPIFSVSLGWFPTGDSYSFPRPKGLAGILDVMHHAVLPITVLALAYIPVFYAIMRGALLGILDSDYVRTARAKGIPEKRVLFRHAVRVALLPLVTAVALEFGQLLGGVTLIETVFNYRGLGQMMFEAVKTRDYPLLQGGFLFFTVIVLTINLLTDMLYPRLDPRTKRARE